MKALTIKEWRVAKRLLPRSLSTRLAAVAGLFLLPSALAICGAVLLLTFNAQLNVERQLAHETAVERDGYTLFRAVLQAESSTRGFLLSGDGEYLVPYGPATKAMTSLRIKIGGELSRADQKAVFHEFDPLVRRKLKLLDQAVTLRKSGKGDQVTVFMRMGAGEHATAAIRARIMQFVDLQDREIARLNLKLQRIASGTTILVTSTFLGMFFLIVGSAFFIGRGFKERDRSEERLKHAMTEAEAANLAKSDFLANMSHEIRTPLNGVLAMAQLMARGELEAEQRQKLDVIRASGEDLLHVINDILDFSKIEAGKLELENIEFDPRKVLEGTLAGFAAVAERKDIELHLEVAPDARNIRLGDPTRLRQIVNNFVSNALKFTDRGAVRIRISGEGADGREGLTVTVRDSGIGIAPEKMTLLFRKFSQVDASTTRQFGGTGLGLAICRELAVMMGGRVWAESEAGQGSTFCVTMALPYVGECQAEAADDIAFDDFGADQAPLEVRILAAEDNPTNQLVLKTIMGVFGFDLTVVGNGREAVETWARGGFDLILMDVQMPEMDGVTATRLIREAEAAQGLARTPIIALSANAFSHQISEYAAAGMDAHVAKPIELATLQSTIERVLCPPPDAQVLAG